MIKGSAEFHFNELTAMFAFQEYLDRRATSIGHVLVKSVMTVSQNGVQTFVVKVAEEAVNESFQRETS
jgi:hypothetical protein